jgi:hypothetical protein
MIGAEYPLSGTVSAVAQTLVSSPVLRGFGNSEVDGSHASLVLGLSGSFSGRWRWEASLQEDVPPDTVAIDFTIGLGIRATF